jgi:hypothetical protein
MNTNCPKCHAKGVIIQGYDNLKARPEFKCRCCEHVWTYGNDGGQYFQVAITYMEKCGMEIPKKPPVDADGFNIDFIKKWS